MRLRILLLIFSFLLQTAFSQEKNAKEAKLLVFAAASLKDAFESIAKEYKKENTIDVIFSFASSSTLARQIENGAPPSLFISADEQWMNYLDEKNLLEPATKVNLLGNELVLIAPSKSPLQSLVLNEKTPWQSLLGKNEYLSVGDPDHVPAGIYAKEALEKLGAWQSLSSKLARANDVRGALLLVERSESPLGIVYKTDALISKKVKIIAEFPPTSHSKIIYPLAIIKGKKNKAALDFYQYLQSDKAKEIFTRYGFEPKVRPPALRA